MFTFKSVQSKLKSISAITITGFAILISLIIFYSQTQKDYSEIKNKSSLLQEEIIKLEYISKQKANEKFFDNYAKVIQNLNSVNNAMDNMNLNTNSLKYLEKQLNISKKSYEIVFKTQQDINTHLQLMHKSKEMIKEIFQKVYDYKLIQYMMQLELYEKTFFLTNTIDLKEFGKVHFKMRRSVRGSENFTENKIIQKKINGELIQYKNMLEIIVKQQKQITILQQQLNKDFNATLQILKTNNTIINDEIDQSSDNLLYLILVISAIIGIIEFIVATIISKDIVNNLSLVHLGLNDFFDVISYKKETAQEIIINTQDEFHTIADDINKNINISVELINHNKEVLEEANDILQKVSNGFYGYKIPRHNNVSPDVKDLIININKMLDETKNKFTILNNALEAYGRYNFEHVIPKKSELGLYGDFGSLVASTKLIGNNVSEFLAMILNTGDKLNNDTTTLNKSANELSDASNMQAASLEETSASLEEVTKNILDNTNNAKIMAQYAQELTLASKDGKVLAAKTLKSMDEINDQVSAINEAINIIDQIAFQTNILSLNAAVEAATAGEAGKGFAVVAQEVRNLASRSADAANEIKALVQNAIVKTNEGKVISVQMSDGYGELNSKVELTTQIIQDVSVASTRQHESIKQINDSISSLDKNTQINAQNSQYIAQLSKSISNLAEDLINASSKATFNNKIREQVCDIEMVYETAELKNEHILLKSKNFEKLGTYERWKVEVDEHCNMNAWLERQENENKNFIHTKEWNELKTIHSNIHSSIQQYVDSNAQLASNEELRKIAATIESNTLMLFDKFNEIKILNCKN